jgi:hypothetical protein
VRTVTTPIRLVGFAIAGLIAGMLSCFVPRLQLVQSHDKVYSFIGAFLGVVLPLYHWLFEERRSVWRAVGFLIASTCAYYLAMVLGMMSMSSLKFLRFSIFGINREEVTLMVVGGFVGANILYLAYALLYCHGTKARAFFSGWALTAILGSVLALVGYGIGTKFAAAGSDVDICTLFIVWQAGIACTLGFMMIQAEGSEKTRAAAGQ